MNLKSSAGLLLLSLRLQRNWSQETLCHGICAVSNLSKIEQGKVDPSEQLLADLFVRLDTTWHISAEISNQMTHNKTKSVRLFSGRLFIKRRREVGLAVLTL